MTEPKIKAAFEKLEFSKDFEENTINKINAKKAERTRSKKKIHGKIHLPAGYVIKTAIACGIIVLIGTGAYAAKENLFQKIWGSKADIIEPYLNNEKYSMETKHYKFTVENIFLSENSAQYIMNVKAKTEEGKKELDINKATKSLSDHFTKHSCTGLTFKSGDEKTGGGGSIRLLADISENGNWYLFDSTKKDDNTNYSSVIISAWAKWNGKTEQAEFDIPAKNVQKGILVPAGSEQFNIKKYLVNSSGISAKANNIDNSKIEPFLENGILFRVTMKDNSTKTYGGGLVYHDNSLTVSCLFDKPVKPEDIKNVEIAAKN